MMTTMNDDTRKVLSIQSEWKRFDVTRFGSPGEEWITAIEIYQEPGQMSAVNYAAVYREGLLKYRVDLAGWLVEYDTESA